MEIRITERIPGGFPYFEFLFSRHPVHSETFFGRSKSNFGRVLGCFLDALHDGKRSCSPCNYYRYGVEELAKNMYIVFHLFRCLHKYILDRSF